MTPEERRNFVSVVPAAKKSKLCPIFFQNIRVIYKLSMKKQKTGQKTEKKPPKKVSDHIQPQAGYGLTISRQTEPAGRRGWKKHLFWRVFLGFLSCFLPFHRQFVCEMPLLQKKLVRLTSSSRRSADYKVPPPIGGHHFLLCQYTNTKDIAGQSATC